MNVTKTFPIVKIKPGQRYAGMLLVVEHESEDGIVQGWIPQISEGSNFASMRKAFVIVTGDQYDKTGGTVSYDAIV